MKWPGTTSLRNATSVERSLESREQASIPGRKQEPGYAHHIPRTTKSHQDGSGEEEGEVYWG